SPRATVPRPRIGTTCILDTGVLVNTQSCYDQRRGRTHHRRGAPQGAAMVAQQQWYRAGTVIDFRHTRRSPCKSSLTVLPLCPCATTLRQHICASGSAWRLPERGGRAPSASPSPPKYGMPGTAHSVRHVKRPLHRRLSRATTTISVRSPTP